MLRPTKKFVVAGGLVAGMLASGVAWAAWTADGSGNGYAAATTAEVLTTGTATASAELYPGGNGEVVTVGSDLKVGERPQLSILGDTSDASRLVSGADVRAFTGQT